MPKLSKQQLEYFVNHVFMPPELPNGAEPDGLENDRLLCQVVLDAALEFSGERGGMVYTPLPESRHRWKVIAKLLQNLVDLRLDPSADKIQESLLALDNGDSFVVHARKQNAAIIIRSCNDAMRFEIFEVSAPNDKIMSGGKLGCTFPGPAIDISHSMKEDSDFISELARFLHQMSSEAIDDAQPIVFKAKKRVRELRDTTNPRYITQLLTGILRGIGHPAAIERIHKRIGDEVHWNNAFLPWRRSPFWLVLRVALQTTLIGSGQSHQEYKSFMAYLLAKLLELAVDAKFPSDLIHIMHSKLSRRMTKLHESFGPINNRLLSFLTTTGNASRNFRTQQWENIQKCQVEPIHWAPQTLDFEKDIVLSLTHSRSHINRILTGKSETITPVPFHPNELPRYLPPNHTGVDFDQGVNDLENAIKVDAALALADFEEAVGTYLEDWVIQKDDDDNAVSCASLAQYFRVYVVAASKLYEPNVEEQSVMLLTLFELWMAIDRLTTRQLPLLRDYHPEVSPALIEVLLLRTFKSIQRGICIMDYCRMRVDGAKFGSIFSDTISGNSFSVRYFQTSLPLKHIKSQIEQVAQAQRSAAIQTLLRTKKEYEDLMSSADGAEHDYNQRGKHNGFCQKCLWTSQAKSLRVPIHEWPLPEDELKAFNVIFELQAPPVFCTWRDITYDLLCDICTPADSWPVAESHEELDTYNELFSYNAWTYRERHMGLASCTKSFKASHYKNVRPTASEDDICRPNGLQFRLYDSLHRRWAANTISPNVSRYCTFQLPASSPYRSLQFSINSTLHTSNFVLARQSECARALELNEFIAFGTLRAGGRLQWLNIAREIAAKGLSMERSEVQVLMMQSIWQIGPVATDTCQVNPLLDWHEELENTRFSRRMLYILDSLHKDIRTNWMQMRAAHTVTLIACRLLAFAKGTRIRKAIFAFMRCVRKTIYGWMHDLRDKLRNSDGDSIDDFQVRLCEAAASCRATYDLEGVYVEKAFRTREDVSIFIECAITMCDNMPLIQSPSRRSGIRHLLDRDRRISRSLETSLVARLSGDPSVLQTLLQTMWASCPDGIQFGQMSALNGRWFASLPQTPDEPCVHLNILTGQLLVDGRPIGRLPREISEHPMYSRIFGSAVLDVTLTRNKKMPYAIRDCIRGYRVTLGLAENGEAIAVEAEDAENGRVFNMIPHTALRGDLPTALVDSYAHWVERSTGHVELRPLESPWDTADEHWWMRRQSFYDGTYRMRKSSISLFDIRSSTVAMISSHLARIEASERLIVTHSSDFGLSVELPRYRLQFRLQGNNLLSENHPGFIVDSSDTVGTFIGLRSRLVLAPPSNELYTRRRLIVPRGEVHIEPTKDHVTVTIKTGDMENVSYHEYEVDETLGHLLDNGDMLSRLTKVYIHAITSFCLPDPLSGLTGTEMAIEELRSSSCLSFQKLQDSESRMLSHIRRIAPQREWYPPHLQVMQTTHWHPHLSFLSQHDDFGFYSSIIMQHAERIHSGDQPWAAFDVTTDIGLADRAVFRHGWYYTASLQRPRLLEDIPHSYEERNANCNHAAEHEVASLSTIIFRPGTCVDPVLDLWAILKGWSTLNDSCKVDVRYSHKWCKPKWCEIWLELCRTLRGARRPSLLFTLSTAAYTSPGDLQLVHTLLALVTDKSLRGHRLPVRAGASTVSMYDLSKGTTPDCTALKSILRRSADFEKSPYYDATEWDSLTRKQRRRETAAFEAELQSQTEDATNQLVHQWPCENPWEPRPSDSSNWLFDLEEVMPEIRVCFVSWHRNHILYQHVAEIQRALTAISLTSTRAPSRPYHVPLSTPHPRQRENQGLCTVSLISLIKKRIPPALPPAPSQISGTFITSPSIPHTRTDSELKRLFDLFRNGSDNLLRQRYGEQLEASREALVRQPVSVLLESPTESECKNHVIACESHFNETLSIISNVLHPAKHQEQTFAAGLWPRLTSKAILGLLSHITISCLIDSWRSTIMQVAYSLLVVQRARRLHALTAADDKLSLERELQNVVPDDECNPDNQLIQIEGDFLARPTQRSVAKAMIGPRSGRSTLQQLQMGEGKSSVIVPLVAAHLSNGKALARVIVLKPLVPQMFRILARRLSGLAQRRIYYMPVSRDMKINDARLRDLQKLWEECVKCRGVLIAQPEHVLSFKLMVAEHNIRFADAPQTPSQSFARSLLKSAKWLSSYSRDILDESDEILRVKYQVIYTMGLQEAIYDHPNRWLTNQSVLSRVRKHIPVITRRFPDDITVEESKEGFPPRLRSIGASAISALVNAIVKDALDGKLITCPQLSHLSPPLRSVAEAYVTKRDISPPLSDDVLLLCSHCGENSSMWKTILLLRGLLAYGVLSYAIGTKCYRIDYGLAPERSMLAVPYVAKDVPSLRAEFGHPDVSIILTCLSYHYGGLTAEQVNQCFEILLGLDHRKQEYAEWVRVDLNIPEFLRDLDGVNLEDPEQRKSTFLFRYNPATVDFFLSQVVFPKGAKEFPQKMATSGWDLVESKKHITTGFSGTNDNRFLLPASVEQEDDPDQQSTNARVISFLLQPENNDYTALPTASDAWLPLIASDPDITVLLDVGAIMLEYSNSELAQRWLSMRPAANAVVFFSDDDINVMSRDGTVESFASSCYRQRLGECLVYLDDVHTRGTDLKLPHDACAAVTLGPKVTKDRLVQGCMRMRRLGNGQFVKFFAPVDIDRKIKAACKRFDDRRSDPPGAIDVLRWVIDETCSDLANSIPHWVAQGIDYQNRERAWNGFISSDGDRLDEFKEYWLQPEGKTLQEMYGLSATSSTVCSHHPEADFAMIDARCDDLGFTRGSVLRAHLDEEQEREVDVEMEREWQLERPPCVEPAQHNLREEVRRLVRYGQIAQGTAAFVPLFEAMKSSSKAAVAASAEMGSWTKHLIATKDFVDTVRTNFPMNASDYLRPINWILTLDKDAPDGGRGSLILLSPFEANELLPSIRKSEFVHLHMYSPRVMENCISLENLDFYTIPILSPWMPPDPRVMMQLNLVAGQLYMLDFATYAKLLDFLGLVSHTATPREDMPDEITGDGFVLPENRRGRMKDVCPFKKSPIPFIKEIVGLRRKGMSYFPTHLGKILITSPLSEEDFV